MPGLLIIAKKEFVDHVSDQTFLLCFGALVFAMVVSAHYQTYMLRINLLWGLSTGNEYWKNASWFDQPNLLTQTVITQITTIGVLLAIVLSFNAINKERTEGSLKVLLSYPIYRDKVILGKLLACSILLTLVVSASMASAFGVIIYYLGIPLTLELTARMALTTVMAILMLLFFLGLGIAISTILTDTSTIIIVLVLVACLLNSETVAMVFGVVANYVGLTTGAFDPKNIINFVSAFQNSWTNGYWPPSLATYARFSPVESFRIFTENIFGLNYQLPNGDILPLTLDQNLMRSLDLIAIQIVWMTAVFILSYVLFQRRDLS
jgi:ABC-2 type transport system permease protein